MEDKISQVTSSLQDKYPNAGIRKVEIDEKSGKSTLYLNPNKQVLAYLEKGHGVVPRQYRAQAATISRDAIDRTYLDLAAKDPYEEDPKELFKKAIRYYYTDPLLGSVVNLLASLACKGFENDIDDSNIKQFYDVWAFDVKFKEVLEWVFLDFFKVGHVTTYKVLAKYEPRVSYLSPIPGQKIKTNKTQGIAEDAAKKNIWSKGHLPVAYTVLNPELVNIEGNLLFDKTTVKLTPPPELRELLQKSPSELTQEEKDLIKALPSDLKAAAEKGGEFQLDSRLVGSITYRKQPYERYAKPRSTRIFDSLEYKKALKQADLSTLDGISNYILKITIGNDEYPVVTQEELEAVSQLFNTPSKSFDVVWNHTLKIEKIVSPEIGDILGQDKYKQVNEDLTAGLAISRSMIDGVGNTSNSEVSLLIKGVMEEINYARRQITRWIYREYQQIAEAMGFDRFPKIRWDEGILKDTILYMNTLAQLVDRRMLSYRTALEELGYDFPNEKSQMEDELPLVEQGIFGIIGSPWQQAKKQPTQVAPEGTPSNGRPTGQTNPSGTRQEETDPQKKVTKTTKSPKQSEASVKLKDLFKHMSDAEFFEFFNQASKLRMEE